jgi:hypothetical protein
VGHVIVASAPAVTAAAVVVVIANIVLPFLVLSPPYGLGLHPFVVENLRPASMNSGFHGASVAGLLGLSTAGLVAVRRRDTARRDRILAIVTSSILVALVLLVLLAKKSR